MIEGFKKYFMDTLSLFIHTSFLYSIEPDMIPQLVGERIDFNLIIQILSSYYLK